MIRAKQIHFKYPQANRGLVPTSLEISAGELSLLTGPSGCGKSTLARCLIGLIPHLYRGKLSGEVWLNGYRTTDVPMWKLAEKAGMVFQNPASQMLASSVEEEIIFGLENLGLDRAEIDQRLAAVLDQFDLENLRFRSPNSLSGGEQQKLALAAILARRPEVLILDEPLSMLDTTAAGELVAYLKNFVNTGKTVVAFEHRHEFFEEVLKLRLMSLGDKNRSQESLPDTDFLPDREKFELIIEKLCVDLGGSPVLRDINLNIKSGEWVAVVGRNGVGKTTLLRALAGLQKFGGRIETISDDGERPADFGMVFQNPDLQIFNASVREEILYRTLNPNINLYDAVVKSLGLKIYEDTPPLLLSEGEKKRVGLAMVMMRQPLHGVLLDEPSLGLDSGHKEIFSRMMCKLADSGQVVIMTTHDLTLASQADRIILLGKEGVIANDATEKMLKNTAIWEQAGIRLPDWFMKEWRRRKTDAS